MTQVFDISSEVRVAFPEIKVAYATIEGMQVPETLPESFSLLRERVISDVRQMIPKSELAKHPKIAGFRDIYKRFGYKPSQKRCSSEALLRRVLDPEKQLYEVNPVVDCSILARLNINSLWVCMMPIDCIHH
ncbi:MAG: hypothetical protein F6K62_10885 [Sphaerospermopsis sp. SIO1G2]|nr:hypothetical protein [Sphaerospermopsis sp. SIO1G2]